MMMVADDIGQLGMIQPGVKGQPECSEARQTGSEILSSQHMWPCCRAAVANHIAGIPAGRVTHTAKSSTAGPYMCLQHRFDTVAECQVGEAHDTGGDTRRPIETAGTHGRDTGDKLSFADRPHLFWPAGAVHGVTFFEHRSDNAVAGTDIGEKVVEQVAMIRPLPQVMVGIDNGQVRSEDRLRRLFRQPHLVRRGDPAKLSRLYGHAHADSLSCLKVQCMHG
jgi:hypothetical protein